MHLSSRFPPHFICIPLILMTFSKFASIAAFIVLNGAVGSSLSHATETVDTAEAAYQRKDYAIAHKLAAPAADAGDARAQYRLGVLLRDGLGTEKSLTAAANWFARASAQKHLAAMTDLAVMYQAGEGVERDTRRAATLLTEAAELGDPVAQFKLGEAYQHGRGVTKSVIHARYWYERADAHQASAEQKATPSEGGTVGFKSLPDSCRPKRPPVHAMNKASVKEFSGVITAYLDREGRVRGVTDKTINEAELKYVAVAWFSETLRSPDCVIPSERRGYWFAIPFKFVLR